MASSETPSSAGQILNIISGTLTQRDLNDYLPLYKAILQSNLEAAEEILDNDPDASKARINSYKQTTLHIAVATCKPYRFLEKLVELMVDNESIALKDDSGNTALSIAAVVGNREAAVLLVNRMNSLLYVVDSFGNFPVHQAAQFSNKDMLEYLINQTRDDLDINPYASTDGLRLLTYVIDAEFFDVAINLVQKYPYMATLKLPDGTSALKKIAAKRSLFFNTKELTYWERILSSTRISKDKSLLIHQAIELVKCLCKTMGSMSHGEAADIYSDAILIATELGSYAVVEQIVEAFPDAVYCSTPSSKQSILHIAVLNRSADVFNLIYQKQNSDHKHLHLNTVDSDGNNLLHAAAKLAPFHKLNEVSSIPHQMQREILWYKAMECILHPNCRYQPNGAGKTPKMVFAEEHMKLQERAEKWMKDVANFCMVIAILIAGAAFGASITVPGGLDSNSGIPNFSKEKAFVIYMDSTGSSFQMAAICLTLLLLTVALHANEDSLSKIETLLLSVYTLGMSILFMMVSFAAAIDLVSNKMEGAPNHLIAWMLFIVRWPSSFLFLLQATPVRHYFFSHTMYGPIKSFKKTDRPFLISIIVPRIYIQ